MFLTSSGWCRDDIWALEDKVRAAKWAATSAEQVIWCPKGCACVDAFSQASFIRNSVLWGLSLSASNPTECTAVPMLQLDAIHAHTLAIPWQAHRVASQAGFNTGDTIQHIAQGGRQKEWVSRQALNCQ